MQEDVGKERTDAGSLWRSPVRLMPLIALEDTSLEPHPNEAEDARVGASMRSSHSWSTESKKLRMSASSTRVTFRLMIAVCNADRA